MGNGDAYVDGRPWVLAGGFAIILSAGKKREREREISSGRNHAESGKDRGKGVLGY